MTRILTTFAAAALISALAACSGTQTADTSSASLGAVSTDNSSLPSCCATKKAAGKTCADPAKCGAAKDGAAPACCGTKATEGNKAAISGEAATPGCCSKATKGNKAAISSEKSTSGCCPSKTANVKKAAISGECPFSGGATPPCCASKKTDN